MIVVFIFTLVIVVNTFQKLQNNYQLVKFNCFVLKSVEFLIHQFVRRVCLVRYLLR